MKDLDFDELDRAVNSLIGGTQNQTDEATSNASTGLSDAPANDATTTASVTDAAPASLQPLAARRSSGRFMDVVHPSSDMRSSFVPPRPSSREGVTIQPASPSVAEEPVLSTPAPVAEPVNQAPAAPAPSEWPDPIDFKANSTSDTTVDEPAEVSEPAPVSEPEPSLTPPFETEPAVPADNLPPLESPFIADAKVEKRPLGAFADTPAGTVDAPVEEPAEATTDDKPASEDVPDNGTPMPAELQNDLLSIESNEDTAEVPSASSQPEAFTAPVAVSTPAPAPVQSAQPAQASSSDALGTVAIPQQYVEQPSTGDKPAGSIFDVDSYHKPIAHPKKKKSGWLMIVWIILLILLGAGAGAAFYFYVLPNL